MPLTALATSIQGSFWGGKCAPGCSFGRLGDEKDHSGNREAAPCSPPRSKPPPSPVLLGIAGRLDDLGVSDITDRPPPSLLLRFIGSQTSNPAALVQILSIGLQVRVAAGGLRLVPSRHGQNRKRSVSRRVFAPTPRFYSPQRRELPPASHHNFLLVAQTAATVTLLSIHHQAGASGIPLAKTHLLLQLLLLLSVPEAVAAGGGAAAAGGGTGLNPSPNPVSLTPTSLIPTPSWPSMTQLILANNKARHQSRARNQPMGTGNKKNQRARAEFSEHPASSSKPGVGGARKKRRREWRGGRREKGARKVAQSL